MTDPKSLSDNSKEDLRQRLRARRSAVIQSEHDHASRAVTERVEPILDDFEVLAGFAAFQNEIELADIYRLWLESNKRLMFPRVTGPGSMVFVEVASLDELEPGAFGIPEPPGSPADPGTVDVFFVPGLAFDRYGNRLGFGGGFYDRALGALRESGEKVPLFIGIGYSWQVLDFELPAESWDVRLDRIVTDTEAIICSDGQRMPEEVPE